MKERTRHWVKLSDYDLTVADSMLKAGHYVYVVFMCHLSIEKLLKGCVVEFTDREFPPYTHNLRRLAELSELELPEKHRVFVAKLSAESVATRYPEDLGQHDKETAQRRLKDARELHAWLKQRLKSKR